MIKSLVKFLITLSVSIILIFVAHISVSYLFYNHFFPDNILKIYLFNFVLTLGIYFGTYFFILSKNLNAILFYCFGTLFKFFLFFIFLYPIFLFDGEIENIEILSFFIPYSTCLIIEIHELSKVLNAIE